MNDLNNAKQRLSDGTYTCVICRGKEEYTSSRRGVAPLVDWLESGKHFEDFCAADKVVGKATAFLYVLLGVKAVYARVISRSALRVLTEHSVVTEYDELVDHIVNRRGDGICPFEAAVLDVEAPTAAYEIICRLMSEMNG